MRAVVQRVSRASVDVDGERISQMGEGLLVLVGVGLRDTDRDAVDLARKVVGLRIFEDAEGKMNHSLADRGGTLGLVSQFTLWADVRKGRRPSFGEAAPPERAGPLFERVVAEAEALGVPVITGKFRAMMDVALVNAGPVTILLDTERRF
ncbi:MAG: D-tyrosyl-tRNA(Tyr) deacylase [bacterium]|nr:D-tyrosyl-tRNA(Tyr) deacylase [Deltaproteobacteria bacterium]MCP4909008.1 D-tyrosyl-tRNA(Tyr) deacylase [bacterium]